MKILCVGMMICDTILRPIPEDLFSHDSVKIEKPTITTGGDALNATRALANLGEDVEIVGCIGNDSTGRFILDECDKMGAKRDHVKIYDNYGSCISYALVKADASRNFLCEHSIFEVLDHDIVPDELLKETDILHFGSAMAFKKMDRSGTENLFRRAKEFGVTTVMDAALASNRVDEDWMANLEGSLKYCDIFLPSIEEAQIIARETDLQKIKEKFKKFNLKVLGIKLGSEGCFITNFEEDRIIPCAKGIKAVDTTGAGDSFVGGFICGLSHGWDIFKSAAFANCVAGKSVEVPGAAVGVPSFEEAYEFYKTQNYE